MYLRFGAAIGALGAAAAAIVIAVTLVRSVPGPTSPASSAPVAAPASGGASVPAVEVRGGRVATPGEPGFPSPPENAVVLAREAGLRGLAVAVKPGLVRVSVLGTTGGGEAGLNVSLQFGRGSPQRADPCGAGCYQLGVRGTPATPVTVRVGGDPYRFDLPRLPARNAAAIVQRATDTWNALRTLVWHERLASAPTNVLHTVYRAVAPHSLAYTIAGHSAAVIIGGARWDRSSPTAPWRRSIQNPPVTQPQPFWQEATDARLLGTERLGAHRVWRVSFFDPTTPAWFEAWIERATGRTLELKMIAASHFMQHVYGPFNAPVTVAPPT